MVDLNEAFPFGANAPKEKIRAFLADLESAVVDAAAAVPATTADLPDATDRRYVTESEKALIAAGGANVGFVYATKAGLDANTTAANGTRAEVVSDPTTALNGVYQKGAGGWTRVQDLPYVALSDRVETVEAISPVTRAAPDDGDVGTVWTFLNKTFGALATISAEGRLRWLAGIDGARPDPDQGPAPGVTATGDLVASGATTATIGPADGMAWLSASLDAGAIVATRQRTAFSPVSKYRLTRTAPFVGMLDDAEARSIWMGDGQSLEIGSNTGLLISTLSQKRGAKAISVAYSYQGVVYPEHIEMLKCWQSAAGFRNDIRQGFSGTGSVPRSTFSVWTPLNAATIVGIEPARSVTTLPGSQYGVTPIESTAFEAVDMAMKKFGVAPRLAIASTGIGGASIANLSAAAVDKTTVLQGFKNQYAALGKRVRPSLHYFQHAENEAFAGASYKADWEAYRAQINAIYAAVFPGHPAPKWFGPTHMHARQAGYEGELALLELDREGKFFVTTPLYGIAWMGGHEWGDAYADTTFPTDWVHFRPWGAAAVGALNAETALSLEAGVTPIKAPRFSVEGRSGNELHLLYECLDDVEINTALIGDPGASGFVVSGGATINSVVRSEANRIAVVCASAPTGFLEYALQAQTSPYTKLGIPRGCVMDTRRVVMRDGTDLPRCATHQRELIP